MPDFPRPMHQTQCAHPVMFFIRPAKGIRLADPKTGDYLPDSGALMPRSGFWLRRLKEGDVVEGRQPGPPDSPDAPDTVHADVTPTAKAPKGEKTKTAPKPQ